MMACVTANDGLILSAQKGYVEVFEFFITLEADAFDEAMRKASDFGHIDIVKLCQKNGATDFEGALRCAANTEILEYCIGMGAQNFNDAIEDAALNGNVETVEFLSKKANINIAMICAASRGHDNVVKFCLEHGANNFEDSMLIASLKGFKHIEEMIRKA